MKDIVIIGAGGLGKEIAWLIEDINKTGKKFNLLGFLDDGKIKGENINNYKVLGGSNTISDLKNIFFVVAIGNAKLKKVLVEKAIHLGAKPVNLIHPSVIISENNLMGEGIVICAGNIITVNVQIENFVTLNSACTIGHDTKISEYTTVYPCVSISGNCEIGKLNELGTRTAIIQGIKLGEEVITGAGSVIIKDVEDRSTVVGVPGKIVKRG
ncbi:MAG: acetyltransferase [Sarcina sp.]